MSDEEPISHARLPRSEAFCPSRFAAHRIEVTGDTEIAATGVMYTPPLRLSGCGAGGAGVAGHQVGPDASIEPLRVHTASPSQVQPPRRGHCRWRYGCPR